MGLPDIQFVEVGNGRMALYHRPGNRDLALLRDMGCTHVVTLLKESEGAQKIGNRAENAGLTWIWLPVPNGNYPEGEVHQLLIEAMPRLSQLLDDGAWLLVHCSAGIHRTGTVAYGLLRWRGLGREEALSLIARMRMITHDEMGVKRQRWGDEIARDSQKQKMSWVHFVQKSIRHLWNS